MKRQKIKIAHKGYKKKKKKKKIAYNKVCYNITFLNKLFAPTRNGMQMGNIKFFSGYNGAQKTLVI
jgi:hypothetical protein